jgi:hypothetical protein
MIKMISVCGKSCDFFETNGKQTGCCHQQAVMKSPEDRLVDVKNKMATIRKFTQIDEMFKKFDGGFPAWCPLAREIREVKNGTDETASI